MKSESEEELRLDKWLWAARFFKTRALATEAINGGKVHVNRARVKPSKKVEPGMEIRITQGPYEKVVIVQKLLAKRGSASVAQTMYEETPESIAKRGQVADQLRYVSAAPWSEGRPNKKDRRQLRKLKYGQDQ